MSVWTNNRVRTETKVVIRRVHDF